MHRIRTQYDRIRPGILQRSCDVSQGLPHMIPIPGDLILLDLVEIDAIEQNLRTMIAA
jgi:hypothetical protein